MSNALLGQTGLEKHCAILILNAWQLIRILVPDTRIAGSITPDNAPMTIIARTRL